MPPVLGLAFPLDSCTMLSHTGYTLPLSGGEKRKQQQINKKQSRAKQGVTTGEHSCKNGFKNEQSECVKQKKKKRECKFALHTLSKFPLPTLELDSTPQ